MIFRLLRLPIRLPTGGMWLQRRL